MAKAKSVPPWVKKGAPTKGAPAKKGAKAPAKKCNC